MAGNLTGGRSACRTPSCPRPAPAAAARTRAAGSRCRQDRSRLSQAIGARGMTDDSAFKNQVRARMTETGENYTAARRTVIAGRDPGQPAVVLRVYLNPKVDVELTAAAARAYAAADEPRHRELAGRLLAGRLLAGRLKGAGSRGPAQGGRGRGSPGRRGLEDRDGLRTAHRGGTRSRGTRSRSRGTRSRGRRRDPRRGAAGRSTGRRGVGGGCRPDRGPAARRYPRRPADPGGRPARRGGRPASR
jgi:hypothetical protein